MTTLLSLPSEIIIDVLIAAPTTRTLLRLSCVSRHIRAIWHEHSQHILASAYQPKIPHIEEAISLTLVEARCEGEEMPFLGEHSKPHLYLPRVLRNAGLATSVCDAANRDNSVHQIDWETEDPYTDMIRAYYLIRHIMLAYDNPELRPSVCSAPSGCTRKMHAGNTWLRFFLLASASMKLKFSLGLLEPNTDGWRGPGEDTDYPPYPFRRPARWRATGRVLLQAESNHEYGSEEPLNFDCADHDPLCNSDDDFDDDNDSYSSIGSAEAQTY